MIALQWNPAMGLPEAVALGGGFVLVGAWLALRSSPGVHGSLRAWLVVLRTLGLIAVAVAWLNPGRWVEPEQDGQREWMVLLDRSASMKSIQSGKTTRWEAATKAAEALKSGAGSATNLHVRTFASQLEEETSSPALLASDGGGTDIAHAVGATLEQRGNPLAGLIVISDGRGTNHADLHELGLRARGRGVPVQVVPVVSEGGLRDLSITAMPRNVAAFKGQPVKISVTVENRGLGAIRPTISIHGPDGKEIDKKQIALNDGARESLTFKLPTAPENGTEYTVRAAPWPGEQVQNNNSDVVRVNVLTARTRVLLLEGAPYWDSKFLAQLLRQEGAIDILTVHRLNEERYFRVEAKGAEPLQSPDSVFPPTAAELSRYDLIVFGKGADGFLDPARIAALQGFVRDQGGTVLFARGKPYSGQFTALESLEPVEWGEDTGVAAQLIPVADSSFGLFGSALPTAEDPVWKSLPPLEDVRNISRLKPFTRVLAEGAMPGHETKVPLLVARRYGRGMVAAVNADGLWRWDFRPEVASKGAIYQQFWVQLMQWCATYSEFRPGEDYAVRLSELTAEPGHPIRATVAWRGPATKSPQPVLKIFRSGKLVGDAVTTPLPAADGAREWAGVITAGEPGRYEIRVGDTAVPALLQGEARLAVTAPPSESDDLRPDAENLELLARSSGGQVWALQDIEKLAEHLRHPDPAAAQGKPRWEALWAHWMFALLVTGCFGAEWWLRRREGLL